MMDLFRTPTMAILILPLNSPCLVFRPQTVFAALPFSLHLHGAPKHEPAPNVRASFCLRRHRSVARSRTAADNLVCLHVGTHPVFRSRRRRLAQNATRRPPLRTMHGRKRRRISVGQDPTTTSGISTSRSTKPPVCLAAARRPHPARKRHSIIHLRRAALHVCYTRPAPTPSGGIRPPFEFRVIGGPKCPARTPNPTHRYPSLSVRGSSTLG